MKTSVPAVSVASLLFSLALAAPPATPDPSQESLERLARPGRWTPPAD